MKDYVFPGRIRFGSRLVARGEIRERPRPLESGNLFRRPSPISAMASRARRLENLLAGLYPRTAMIPHLPEHHCKRHERPERHQPDGYPHMITHIDGDRSSLLFLLVASYLYTPTHSPSPRGHNTLCNCPAVPNQKRASIIHHSARIARKDSNAIISMPQIAHANPSLSSNFHVLPVALALFMW